MPISYLLSSLVYHFAKRYCRLEVKGRENIPIGSRFLWTHNHSGWIALDAILIGHLIACQNDAEKFNWTVDRMGPLSHVKHFTSNRLPGDWGVTFWNNTLMGVPGISRLLGVFHGLPVEVLKHPEKLLSYRIYATPAEGEEGNCKSSFTDLYKLSRFRHGIARVALSAKVDYISPAVIVGPEESFPCLGRFGLLKNVIGTILPVPLLMPPIPVKWVVKFLPPVEMSQFHKENKINLTKEYKLELLDKITETFRERIENALKNELVGRKAFRPWFLWSK